MSHIQIKTDSDGKSIVKIDGIEIKCSDVAYCDYENEPTRIDLTFSSPVDIDVEHVQARLHFSPQNIIDANAIIRHELLTQGDYYGGFLGSVESALAESGTCTNIHDLAQAIIDRIVGYEWDDDF